jgi:hypothetical protein
MFRRQTRKTFELLCSLCNSKLWARQTDLVVDHLQVLVALLQSSAKLYNIRVLRMAVSERHMRK